MICSCFNYREKSSSLYCICEKKPIKQRNISDWYHGRVAPSIFHEVLLNVLDKFEIKNFDRVKVILEKKIAARKETKKEEALHQKLPNGVKQTNHLLLKP